MASERPRILVSGPGAFLRQGVLQFCGDEGIGEQGVGVECRGCLESRAVLCGDDEDGNFFRAVRYCVGELHVGQGGFVQDEQVELVFREEFSGGSHAVGDEGLPAEVFERGAQVAAQFGGLFDDDEGFFLVGRHGYNMFGGVEAVRDGTGTVPYNDIVNPIL